MEGDGMGAAENQHLIHSFIQTFTKSQLVDLKGRIEAHEPVDLAAFCDCVHRAAPGFYLPVVRNTRLQPQDDRRGTQTRPLHEQAVQHEVLLELFTQLDVTRSGTISWGDVTTLLVDKSDTGSKMLNLYSDVPVEPVFDTRARDAGGGKNTAAQARMPSHLAEDAAKAAASEVPHIGSGKGLHWDQIECLKYFRALRLYCLSGKGVTVTFTLDADTGKAQVEAVLKGPTAAVFNVFHLEMFQKVIVLCADRYIYFYNDSFTALTPSQKLKTSNPQLSAVVVRDQLLCTGGTDGVVLVFTAASANKPFTLLHQFTCGHEYVCDLLYIPELDQLLTAASDGLVIAWDISWDGAQGKSTFKVRNKTKTHHASVKTQVSYNAKYRLVFTIGPGGHSLLCWNSFICSQSHLLKGHDKPIVKIHAFDTWPEVISADMSGKIIVWDSRHLVAVQCFGGAESAWPVGPLTTFAYNPDCNMILSIGDRFCVFPPQLERKGALNFKLAMLGVLHSARRGLLVTYTRERVFVWNAHSGQLEKEYACFERSHVTTVALVNNGEDMAVGSAEGEIHFVSLLSKVWFDKASCGEGIVTLHPVDQHTPSTYILYTGAKSGRSPSWYTSFATPNGRAAYPQETYAAAGSEAKMLFVVTVSGEVQVMECGTGKCDPKPLHRWQMTLGQLSQSVLAPDHSLLAAYGEKELEIWETVPQKLRHSMRCRSAVRAAAFAPTLEAFLVLEEAGFLHVYTCPGYTYLLRFRFLHANPLTGAAFSAAACPVSMHFVPDTNELVCLFSGCAKVLQMADVVTRQRNHAHRHICGNAERLLNGRYVEVAAESVKPGGCVAAYDTQNQARVLMCASATRQSQRLTEMLQMMSSMGATLEWLEHFFYSDEPEGAIEPRTVHVNVIRAPDVTFDEYMLVRRGAAQVRPADAFAIAQGICNALCAFHSAGLVAFLTPSKVAYAEGRWMISSLSDVVDQGVRVNPAFLDWLDTPPEVVSVKKRYDHMPLDASNVGELGFEARLGVDLWGLGLLLWTALRGVGVFEGVETAQLPERLIQFDVAKERQRMERAAGAPAAAAPDPLASPKGALDRARAEYEESGCTTDASRLKVLDGLLDWLLVRAPRRCTAEKALEYVSDDLCLPSTLPTPTLYQPFPRQGPLVARQATSGAPLASTLTLVEADPNAPPPSVPAQTFNPKMPLEVVCTNPPESPTSFGDSIPDMEGPKFSFSGASKGPKNPQRKPSLSASVASFSRRGSTTTGPPSPTSPHRSPRRGKLPAALPESPTSRKRDPLPETPVSLHSGVPATPPATGPRGVGSPQSQPRPGPLLRSPGNTSRAPSAQKRHPLSTLSTSMPTNPLGKHGRLLPSRARLRMMRCIDDPAPVPCRTLKPHARERFTAAHCTPHFLGASNDGPLLFACEHSGSDADGRAAVSCRVLGLGSGEEPDAVLGALPLQATVSCLGFPPETAAVANTPPPKGYGLPLLGATSPAREPKSEWAVLDYIADKVQEAEGEAGLMASVKRLPVEFLTQRGLVSAPQRASSSTTRSRSPSATRAGRDAAKRFAFDAVHFLQRQVQLTQGGMDGSKKGHASPRARRRSTKSGMKATRFLLPPTKDDKGDGDATRKLTPFFSALMCCSMDVVRPFYLNKKFEMGSEKHIAQIERKNDTVYRPLCSGGKGVTAAAVQASLEEDLDATRRGKKGQPPTGMRQAARGTKAGQRVLGMDFLTSTPVTAPPPARLVEPKRLVDVLDDARSLDPTLFARPYTVQNHRERQEADKVVGQSRQRKAIAAARTL